MSLWCVIFVLALGLIGIKVILNASKLLRLKALEKAYHEFMKKMAEGKATPDFLEKTPEIIELLKKAGQQSSTITRVKPAGLGFAQTLHLDLFENITANDQQFYNLIFSSFKQAIGVYKKRIYESVNPLYWIEFLIFLPQNLINYILGDEQHLTSNWIVRLLNAIYWIVGFIGSIWAIVDRVK